jgi:hypothetical protein
MFSSQHFEFLVSLAALFARLSSNLDTDTGYPD